MADVLHIHTDALAQRLIDQRGSSPELVLISQAPRVCLQHDGQTFKTALERIYQASFGDQAEAHVLAIRDTIRTVDDLIAAIIATANAIGHDGGETYGEIALGYIVGLLPRACGQGDLTPNKGFELYALDGMSERLMERLVASATESEFAELVQLMQAHEAKIRDRSLGQRTGAYKIRPSTFQQAQVMRDLRHNPDPATHERNGWILRAFSAAYDQDQCHIRSDVEFFQIIDDTTRAYNAYQLRWNAFKSVLAAGVKQLGGPDPEHIQFISAENFVPDFAAMRDVTVVVAPGPLPGTAALSIYNFDTQTPEGQQKLATIRPGMVIARLTR